MCFVVSANDCGRFQVKQPVVYSHDQSNRIRVLFRPGPVAPGMSRRLEVEFTAVNLGHYSNQIVIATEKDIFRFAVTANVIPKDEYASHEVRTHHLHHLHL